MPSFHPPAPGKLAYYRVWWAGGPDEHPRFFWYEVDSEGAVLRTIEIFDDGRVRADAVGRYPGGVTQVAIGSLCEGSFYDPRLQWPWPGEDEIEFTVQMDAARFEFDQLWRGAGEA